VTHGQVLGLDTQALMAEHNLLAKKLVSKLQS